MSVIWLAVFFLPLYPMSAVLSGVYMRSTHPLSRALLLLIWPQMGVALLFFAPTPVPAALVPWGIGSAVFYALRMLTVRDLDRWAVFCAISGWSLTWGLAAAMVPSQHLVLFVLGFSLPAALLAILSGSLVRRFGAAYAGLCTGWGARLPYLSALLIGSALAAIATPPFPGFFGVLSLMLQLNLAGVVAVLLTWLIWGWAAARLLQGFVFGKPASQPLADIKGLATAFYVLLLSGFTLAGIYLARGGVWA